MSELAFEAAPLTFGPTADFPSVGDAEDSKLVAVIKAIPDSRRQGSLFESPDLMATTGWFVPEDKAPRRPTPSTEAMENPESEAGGSSTPLPDAGGTNHICTFILLQFSVVYAYCCVLTD